MYEPNTCLTDSPTNNNLQTGLLKAFWNSYLSLFIYMDLLIDPAYVIDYS